MDHAKEKELAAAAWDATRTNEQPGYEALSAAYTPTLFAKVKSVEQHGPAEGDAFEEEVARLLSQPPPNRPYPEGDPSAERVSLPDGTITTFAEFTSVPDAVPTGKLTETSEPVTEETVKRKRR